MYIAKKAKHSLSLWVINWQMLQQHPHLSEQAWLRTNRESVSLCLQGHNRRASMNYTDTHIDKEPGPQIFKVLTNSTLYVSAVLKKKHGDKRTFSFWLPFGDQNECCIGSVTKTLKAMEAVLDMTTLALNICLLYPEGRKFKANTIFFILIHRNDVKSFYIIIQPQVLLNL